MIGVVPQPGETLPYSELRGLRSSPSLVLNAIVYLVAKLFVFTLLETRRDNELSNPSTEASMRILSSRFP